MTKARRYDATPGRGGTAQGMPVLTYRSSNASFDAEFYNRARAEVSQSCRSSLPPGAKAFEVSAGHFFRIVRLRPASRGLNLWNAMTG